MTGRQKPWDYPSCPDCDSDVFVTKTQTAYKCESCDTVFDRQHTKKGTFQQNKRKSSATPIKPATGAEINALYKQFDTFVVPETAHKNGAKQHIPSPNIGEKTLCDRHSGYTQSESRVVDKEVYPKGYLDFCKNCVNQWRIEEPEVTNAGST